MSFQKGSKESDIIKIHQWLNCDVMKLREYFLCTKKTKIITLFNNFFSSVSAFDMRSQQYHDACAAAGLQAEECTRMRHGSVDNDGGG